MFAVAKISPRSLEIAHGRCLVAFAAAVPLGEGLALAALAATGICTAVRVCREIPSLRWPSMTMVGGWALFWGSGLLAVAVGGEGWHHPGELGRWLPFLALPVVFVSVRVLPQLWLQRAVFAFCALLSLSCLFGLLQYLFNARPGEFWVRSADGIVRQGRVPGNYDRSAAGGFFFHRLRLAHVVLVGLGIFFVRQVVAPTMGRIRRLGELGLTALLGTALLLTFARAALVAFAISSFACLARCRWRLARWICLVLGLALVAIPWVFDTAVQQRFSRHQQTTDLGVRAFIWAQAAHIIADHPLGVGLGNYPTVVSRYYDGADPTFNVRAYPHNVVLAALAETGPFGTAGLLVGWSALILLCARALRRERTWRACAGGVGLFVAVAYAVVGMTHDVFYHNAVALAFAATEGACLGLLAASPDDGVAPAVMANR